MRYRCIASQYSILPGQRLSPGRKSAVGARAGRHESDGLERFRLAGKSILITGATGALGREGAVALSAVGARLTLAGANGPRLAEVAQRAGEAVTVPQRPQTPGDAEAMVGAAVTAYGHLGGVLVASGTNHVAPITEMDVTDFERVMDANVR